MSINDPNYIVENGRTSLFYTVSGKSGKSNVQFAQILLNNGADVNIQDDDGNTVLIIACKENKTEIVQLLLKNKADVNIQDDEGDTALIIACENGYKDIVQLLLENKDTDINKQNIDGNTALIMACYNKDIVQLLLENKADLNIQNETGNTALIYTCNNGYKDIVKLLLENKADVTIQNILGNTALFYAFEKDHKEIVQLLVNSVKLELLLTKNVTLDKLLINACNNGYKDIVPILLSKIENLNEEDKDGKTALICACENGYKDIVQLLLDNGADINKQNKDGNTALIMACKNNSHTEIVKLLLDNGANINIQNVLGNTPLIYAFVLGNDNIFELLLKKKANVNIKKYKDGNTVLIMACKKNKTEIVKLLLKNKDTDLNIQDDDGNTGLIMACKNNNIEIVQLLLDNEAIDVNIQDKLGNTALFYICIGKKNINIVKLLLKNKANPYIKNNENVTASSILPKKDKISILFEKAKIAKAEAKAKIAEAEAIEISETEATEAEAEAIEISEAEATENLIQKLLNNTSDDDYDIKKLVKWFIKEKKVDENLTNFINECKLDVFKKFYDEIIKTKNSDLIELIKSVCKKDIDKYYYINMIEYKEYNTKTVDKLIEKLENKVTTLKKLDDIKKYNITIDTLKKTFQQDMNKNKTDNTKINIETISEIFNLLNLPEQFKNNDYFELLKICLTDYRLIIFMSDVKDKDLEIKISNHSKGEIIESIKKKYEPRVDKLLNELELIMSDKFKIDFNKERFFKNFDGNAFEYLGDELLKIIINTQYENIFSSITLDENHKGYLDRYKNDIQTNDFLDKLMLDQGIKEKINLLYKHYVTIIPCGGCFNKMKKDIEGHEEFNTEKWCADFLEGIITTLFLHEIQGLSIKEQLDVIVNWWYDFNENDEIIKRLK